MTKLMRILTAFMVSVSGPAFPGTKSVDFLHGWRTPSGDHMAGIRIILEDGWKTYWRTPQGSGIPPILSVASTPGIDAVKLIYPRPAVYEEFGSEVLGYTGSVTFPIEFDLSNGATDISFTGEFRFAVCKDVCIPLLLNIATELHADQASHASVIKAALAERPKSPSRHGIRKTHCDVSPTASGVGYQAKLRWPADQRVEKIVVEYPSDAFWVAPVENEITGSELSVTANITNYASGTVFLQRDSFRLSILTQTAIFEFEGC